MRRFELAATVALLLMFSATTWAAIATISASRDTSIYENPSSNSAGGAAGIFVGTNGQGSPRRGLIAFEVAAHVPAGALIAGTELRMYLAGAAANSLPRPIALHRLTADWGEGMAGGSSTNVNGGGSGFPASAEDATWNERFFSSTDWSGPGADGDFVAAASSTTPVGNALDTPHSWLGSPAMRDDVQSWLDAPNSNFGWVLISAGESVSQTSRVFYSSEAAQNSAGGALDPSWWPTLIVMYVVPEPTNSMLALLLTLPFFGRRPRTGDSAAASRSMTMPHWNQRTLPACCKRELARGPR